MKSGYGKGYESFSSSDISQKNIIPPWCSLGKVNEKRKLSANWEIQSSYPLRENIWEYLYECNGEKFKFGSKRRNRKACKQHGKDHRTGKTKLLLFIFLCIAGIIATLWKFYPITRPDILSKIIAKTEILTFHWDHSSESEECCHKMRYLALELSRTEHILRNTRQLSRKMMLTSSLVSAVTERHTASQYIQGASATKGRDTEEWGGRVALWGVVPLWRAALPAATVLALRHLTPADCWPFSGSSGELLIKLPRIQRVTSVSVEHVRPDTARSAPKHFIVIGILANNTQVQLADSEYIRNGPAKQFYKLATIAALESVIFRVLTNHGNTKYTCVYRVHLYGNSDELNNFHN